MPNLGNDIDDLFRQAAENYPLRSGVPDWNKVYAKLTEDNLDKPILVPLVSRGNKRLKYLWLLLFIPIGMIVAKYVNNSANTEKPPQQAILKETAQQKNVQPSDNNKNADQISDKNNAASSNSVSKESNINQQTNAALKNSSLTSKHNNVNQSIGRITDLKDLKQTSIVTNKENNNYLSTPSLQNDSKVKEDEQEIVQIQSTVPNPLVQTIVPNIIIKDNNAELEPANQVEAKKNNVSLTKPKRFYIGLAIAPDFTTIKFQSVKKVGLNFGVMLGYQINSKFNVELGVLLDSKHYYTDGKYLGEGVINKDVLYLEGFSSITEFPLSIRYNFKTNKSAQYFASLGTVSYVIHNERYNYVYEKNGVQYDGEKFKRNASNSFFSNMQFSMGYERQIGNLGNFRVEPYYRLPIKGIGVGSLPITSLGVNIGITRKIK